MRQIVLDTETTGLEVSQGHRVIELAGVEVLNRRVSGATFQRYLNPERDIDAGAREVHGIDSEFLQDKPKFREVAAEFLEFVRGAELIIHNAPFDVAFLNAELALAGLEPLSAHCPKVIDTLRLAKELNPGKRASLDSLCERYGVDNAHRTQHGALLDARLLAEVFLAMTRGQDSLVMHITTEGATAKELGPVAGILELPVIAASEEELRVHETMLDDIAKASKGQVIWRQPAGTAP